jgi:hypothetical protein
VSKRLSIRTLLLAFLVLLTLSAAAQAQATRTWVSGVGDDANPCSRTAPCKTFAGAISKTATGGEINVLDPGGFGGVTITKSITISSENFEAGVLVSGTNAIVINATSTSDVVLRGLDVEGLGSGLVGIKVLGALDSLHIEKCTIHNFRGSNGSGIEVATTAVGTTQVYIKDTIVRNNGQGTGAGIFVNPGASATVKASLDNVRMEHNLIGFKSAGAGAIASVQKSVVAGNSGTGIVCGTGTTVRLGNNTIMNNGFPLSGPCTTFGNNDIDAGALGMSEPFPSQ